MKLLLLITSLFSTFFLGAQSLGSSTFSAAGSSFQSDDFSLHFSIGEPLNTLMEEGNLSISQGVIQILLTELALDVNDFTVAGFNAYPNPVDNLLIIESLNQTQKFKYELFAMDGKMIQEESTIQQLKASINFEALNSGIYMLKLIAEDKSFTNLKLIKK